jgi:hypothetical protein
LIEEAAAAGADEITATYDERYGFPVDVTIDYQKMAIDEELGFEIGQITFD